MTYLSEDQRMMRDSCRAFVDDVVLPFIKHNWQREWSMTPEERLPASILEGAEQIGIRTLGVPEEFGGIELDRATEVQTFAVISEEIARGDSGLADKLVQNWKVAVLLRNLAPRHLQEIWFKRLMADPQFLLAHCLTEPRGASDRWLPYNVPEAAMQTRAVKQGSEWVINGRTWADVEEAEFMLLEANPQPFAVEQWTITNKGGGWFHPVHLHLVDGKIIGRNDNGGRPFPWEGGPKDVFYAGENESVTLLTQFDIQPDGEGRFMIHCHNTSHEDHDMMLQFSAGDKNANDPIKASPPFRDPLPQDISDRRRECGLGRCLQGQVRRLSHQLVLGKRAGDQLPHDRIEEDQLHRRCEARGRHPGHESQNAVRC